MPLIHIDNIVSFAPNLGVLVHKDALDISPQRLSEVVQLAYSHMNDKHLLDACHGACGPLAKYSNLQYEEYLHLLEQIRVSEAGAKAKRVHTKARRTEFNSKRSWLVLTMIENGIPYVCAAAGCRVIEQLTVDHITPLSRGGTDELSNLRFLCHRHNSAKRDKIEA